jgi:hypothetical protein
MIDKCIGICLLALVIFVLIAAANGAFDQPRPTVNTGGCTAGQWAC